MSGRISVRSVGPKRNLRTYGVHEEAPFVGPDGLGKSLGALLEDNLPPALGTWLTDVDLLTGIIVQLGDDNFGLQLGLADLTFDAAAVYREVAEVCEELRSAVLAAKHVEELGGVYGVC